MTVSVRELFREQFNQEVVNNATIVSNVLRNTPAEEIAEAYEQALLLAVSSARSAHRAEVKRRIGSNDQDEAERLFGNLTKAAAFNAGKSQPGVGDPERAAKRMLLGSLSFQIATPDGVKKVFYKTTAKETRFAAESLRTIAATHVHTAEGYEKAADILEISGKETYKDLTMAQLLQVKELTKR